jgi:5-methylcytosine-specific restriction endonuclease McrA
MNYQDLPWATADSGTCRVCGCERKDGERWRTWCNGPCLDWYKFRSNASTVRWVIWKRDKGVCALCGFDTATLEAEIGRLFAWHPGGSRVDYKTRSRLRRLVWELAGYTGRVQAHVWEADHIVPVVEGGGMCGPEGFRTLCLPCHHAESAALATRRAVKRRADRNPGPLFEESA